MGIMVYIYIYIYIFLIGGNAGFISSTRNSTLGPRTSSFGPGLCPFPVTKLSSSCRAIVWGLGFIWVNSEESMSPKGVP